MEGDSQPPAAEGEGRIVNFLHAVRGLTLTNALVIILLALVIIPAYIVWKAINSDALLDRLMSNYEVHASQMHSCTLRSARLRGEPTTWSVTSGFAYEGEDKWFIGVSVQREPSGEEITAYCEVLGLVVDYMRSPQTTNVPNFPGTNDPIIWKYKD